MFLGVIVIWITTHRYTVDENIVSITHNNFPHFYRSAKFKMSLCDGSSFWKNYYIRSEGYDYDCVFRKLKVGNNTAQT